jgi:hypothetical protein
MTDYRELTTKEKIRVDHGLLDALEEQYGEHTNSKGFVWNEPDYTMSRVHSGDVCANCLMIYYNCLCSHGD